MPQYYPLQLSGCFGVLPRHLVAEERYSSFYGEITESFIITVRPTDLQ